MEVLIETPPLPSQPLEVMSDSDMNVANASKRKHPAEGKQTSKKAKAGEGGKESETSQKEVLMSPEEEAKQVEKEEKKRQRELKRAEKAEKEAQREARRLKEAQAKAKAASFMSSFMQPSQSDSPAKGGRKEAERRSDFERVFQACTYKDMAPINRFRDGSSSKSTLDVEGESKESQENVLQELRAKAGRKRRLLRSRKGIRPPISVRESMRLITEASVLGDEKLEEDGKRGLENLSDRAKVPMKLIHFESDRRPAWYGTWTRTTNLVGARKPFGQDPVALDYSYDSDAEWEDVDPNDGDDVQENEEREEEDGDRSGEDSEMDDWLVDDLEEEEEEEEAARPDDDDVFEVDAWGQPAAPSSLLKPFALKASATNVLQAKKKKIKPIGRRFDAKLVPFSTGPHWQDEVGKTSYEGFRGYQMQFLNDAQPGLNPFTFETADLLPTAKVDSAAASTASNEVNIGTPAHKAAAGGGPAAAGALAKAQTFPSCHLPVLLQTIEGSTSIRPILVEELKGKFTHLGKAVTKANIEACINVYAEKLSKKMGAKWVVKAEHRSTAGVS